MARSANSFARALKEAEHRLTVAKAERVAAQTKLLSLDMEIPRLERTIAALHGQVNPGSTPLAMLKAEPQYVTPPANMSPEDLAKWYTERDLSAVGSIAPEKPVAPAIPVSEDDLLPDDFEVKN
jgi:hypothetical protein